MTIRRFLAVAALLGAAFPLSAIAESTSENYILWGQATTGGGATSTSANFVSFGSVGDMAGDVGSSENYRAEVGFQELDPNPVLIFNLSGTSVSLLPSPLSQASVSSGSVVATIGTNASFGYSMTLTETLAVQTSGGYAIADVTDGTVTAGSEEFGVAVTGADAAFGDDQALTSTPLQIASYDNFGADRATTVSFRAAIDSGTQAGAYVGTVTFITTGNF